MSALVRTSLCSTLRKFQPLYSVNRAISTSKDKRDTAQAPSSADCVSTESKNWISYGFSTDDKAEDRHFMHVFTFLGVSVTFIFGGMLLAYRPGDLNRDWALREGFLELRRREKAGLPLVDPNYLPISQVILPSDEELGDTEIVI